MVRVANSILYSKKSSAFNDNGYIRLGDAKLAKDMTNALYKESIYVTGFSYLIVLMGTARIRTQNVSIINQKKLDHAIDTFAQSGLDLNIIKE